MSAAVVSWSNGVVVRLRRHVLDHLDAGSLTGLTRLVRLLAQVPESPAAGQRPRSAA
jgi:hypothetical protein